MRIVSLLPSTTEFAFALGLDDEVVTVTYECDYPPEAWRFPVISASVLDHNDTSATKIAAVVRGSLGDEHLIDRLDVDRLATWRPNLILQALCSNGNAYPSCPGSRHVANLELLAGLLHPDHGAGWGPADGALPVLLR